jgi:hypothetical protein
MGTYRLFTALEGGLIFVITRSKNGNHMRVIAKEFYVKNYAKCLGIIAIVAVIGLFAACGKEDPEKTIKVTGVPAEYLQPTIWIDVAPRDKEPVAAGNGQISGNTVTFDLYIWPDGNIRFTETGTWNVHLNGIDGKFIFADNTDIKNSVTTIPFSKFTIWTY